MIASMRYALRREGWVRFVLTTFLIAVVLTLIADQQPGTHNAPIYDWIIFGLAAVRLAYRAVRRRIRRP